MDSSEINCAQDLNHIISCKNEEICMLKRQLEKCDELIDERNCLRNMINELEQCKKQSDCDSKKTIQDLLTKFETQSIKLKKLANTECDWKTKNCELQNINDCLNDQLHNLKSHLNQIQCKLVESEKNVKCGQKEIYNLRMELEETKNIVKKLKTNLKCNEEELCKVHKELDECKCEYSRLNEVNVTLMNDLKCTKTKLCEAKLCAQRAEDNLKLERESMSNELKLKCKKINCLQTQNDEANCMIKEDKCKIKKLVSTLIELKEASLRNHNETKCQIIKLKEEVCAKDDDICRWRNKTNQLQKENDFNCMEINVQKNKLYEKECQLKQMKLLSDKICRMKQQIEICCCSDINFDTQSSNMSMSAHSLANLCCSPYKKKKSPSKCPSNKEKLEAELRKFQCELDNLQKQVCKMSKCV